MEEYKYLIPEESMDAYTLNAALLRNIETKLRSVFDAYHYEELMLPTFEYAGLYQEIRNQDEESMFEFVNSEGKLITLRTDFTVPIARLYNNASTKEVRRYSYFGKVFRNQERHKGRSSELYQGGIELLGLGSYAGDLECLTLIEKTLNKLPVKDPLLELGNAKFYRRLMEIVGDASLKEILDKKAMSEMEKFVAGHDIDPTIKKLLLALPYSFGDINDLKLIAAITDDAILKEAIHEMMTLYDQSNMKEKMVFDLCMVPSQLYYTGIMFRAYIKESAYAILSGGRYDNLLKYFNNDVPAIGFSYHFNTLLKALAKEADEND